MTHLSRGLRAALLLAALLLSAVAAGVAADEIRDLEARLEMMYIVQQQKLRQQRGGGAGRGAAEPALQFG